MKYILGSQSKGRRSVLEKAGYDFEVVPAAINEKAIRHDDPRVLTQQIAKAKADALREAYPHEVIITGDTVVWCNDTILEKPETEEEFRRNYEWFQRMPLEIISAVVVTHAEQNVQLSAVDSVVITYRQIPNDVLDRVVAKDIYRTFAGGVAIEEELLLPYITIDGEYEAAMGLPLEKCKELLTQV